MLATSRFGVIPVKRLACHFLVAALLTVAAAAQTSAQSSSQPAEKKGRLRLRRFLPTEALPDARRRKRSGARTTAKCPLCSATILATTGSCGTWTRQRGRRRCWSAKPDWHRWHLRATRSRTSGRKSGYSATTWQRTSGRPTPSTCCLTRRANSGSLTWAPTRRCSSPRKQTDQRPEVFARRQPGGVRAQPQPLCTAGLGRRRKAAHQGQRREPAERRSGLALRRRTERSQQLSRDAVTASWVPSRHHPPSKGRLQRQVRSRHSYCLRLKPQSGGEPSGRRLMLPWEFSPWS